MHCCTSAARSLAFKAKSPLATWSGKRHSGWLALSFRSLCSQLQVNSDCRQLSVYVFCECIHRTPFSDDIRNFNIIVERSSSTQASNAFLARPSSLNPATHSLRGLQPFDRSMADGGSRGRRPRRSTPRCRRWLRAGSWFGSLCLLFCVCVRGNQNEKCR